MGSVDYQSLMKEETRFPRELLVARLSETTPLTVFRGLEVYEFFGGDQPELLHEIGWLREEVFRSVGAGRGGSVDLDRLDTCPHGYHQLMAWDTKRGEIAAALRFQRGANAVQQGMELLRTHTLFKYDDEFAEGHLAQSLELGRSVVHQNAKLGALGLFALWRGLACAVNKYGITHFFGNVSLYVNYQPAARDLLVASLEKWYRPEKLWLRARDNTRFTAPDDVQIPEVTTDAGPEDRIRLLDAALREVGEELPQMFRAYMGLGKGVRFGESVCDADFADAIEVGIVVPIDCIRPETAKRFGLVE